MFTTRKKQTQGQDAALIEMGITQEVHEEPVSLRGVISGVSALLHSKENLPKLMGVGILTALGTGLNFLSPYLFGESIKLLADDEESTEISGIQFTRTAIIVTLVAAYTMAQVIPNLRGQAINRVKVNAEKNILKRSTEHFLKKSLNFHVNTPIGEMIVLYQKTFSVTGIGLPLYGQIIPTFIEIALASILLSSKYEIEIGLSLIGMLLTYTGYSILTAKPIMNAREESLKTGNETWETIIGALERYKTIHDFGKYEKVIDDVQKLLERMAQKDLRAATLPMNVGLGHVAISRAFMTLIVLMVGLGVKNGKYSAQDFTVLMAYLNQLSILLPEFGSAVNQMFAAYPDLKFVFNELNKPDEVVDLHPDVPLVIPANQAPSIEFDNVSFQYPAKSNATNKPMIFNHLSFKVQQGKKIAFVSESGAGKTTIFNLLFGHYKPTEGTIKINDQDISTLSIKSLQSHIRLFDQSPGLFKASVRENICFGSKNPALITDEMIWKAAREAHLFDFLEKLTLDKDVGERGTALSGGERQKVNIIRCLLKESRIMLLDEITAPLDSQSAIEVMQGMHEASEGMTTLAITHKLTEAKHVDQIIVLSDGKVLDQGTHDELLSRCGLYQKLWISYAPQDAKPAANINKI